MTTTRLCLLAATLVGCTANNTFNVVAPVSVSAPVHVEAAAQVTIASNTVAVASDLPVSPAPQATPAPAPTPTATPTPTPEPTPAPRTGGGGGGGGAGGGGSRVAPTPAPTPTPTPRPLAYAPSTPDGVGSADAAYLATGDGSMSSGNSTSYAQTFKATRTGNLAALALYVLAGGPYFNIAIQGVDNQARPVGPDLGSAELYGNQMWTPGPELNAVTDVWPYVTPAIVRFDPPVPVVAGTTYAWVATPTQGSQHAKWVGTKADGYADGSAFLRLESEWLPHALYGARYNATGIAQDYNFETFVQDAVASDAAASATAAG